MSEKSNVLREFRVLAGQVIAADHEAAPVTPRDVTGRPLRDAEGREIKRLPSRTFSAGETFHSFHDEVARQGAEKVALVGDSKLATPAPVPVVVDHSARPPVPPTPEASKEKPKPR